MRSQREIKTKITSQYDKNVWNLKNVNLTNKQNEASIFNECDKKKQQQQQSMEDK